MIAEARHLFTGKLTRIHVKRRIVDASYTNLTVPAMAQRGYTADSDVALVPINDLPHLKWMPERFTVVGAGKTGIDACVWLLSRGVAPDRVTWIVPREPWVVNRTVGVATDGNVSALLELLQADSAQAVIEAVESWHLIQRRDPDVSPEAFRCASTNDQELNYLRQIHDVVRLGRVRHIGADAIELDRGTVEAHPETLYVDCSADGLRQQPTVPVFDGNRITIQPLVQCLLSISGAVTGHLEAQDLSDAERNDLCRPVPHPRVPLDVVEFFRSRADVLARWMSTDVLSEWLAGSRLNPSVPGTAEARDPEVRREMGRLAEHLGALMQAAAHEPAVVRL